ncbi:MAG: hypothetical protein EXR88_01710 [Gammaproteobacteria bacterium]|nr:hypothetical protein [Gammaproteobacteria bacterium]
MKPNLLIAEKIPELRVLITPKLVIMGAVASRDWQPLHHDHEWSVGEGGLPGIILNNYTQMGWIIRYVTDWSGPQGRVGGLRLTMHSPICPGNELVITGAVDTLEQATTDLNWAILKIELAVGSRIASTAWVKVALPASDNSPSPWHCSASDWHPGFRLNLQMSQGQEDAQ